MTAPDPRLEEIAGRYANLATPQQAHLLSPKINGVSMEMWMIEDDEEIEIGYIHAESDAERILNAPDDVAYLLAELRKAQDKLARVEVLAAEWEELAGSGSDWERVYGKQKVSVDHAVASIRAAVADANGDGHD